jgi:acyl-CoA synthetase (AMP-forming)/AMP-acid ligase II
MSEPMNVAQRLAQFAKSQPHAIAVAAAIATPKRGGPRYRTITFAQLNADSDRIAAGLRDWGVPQGARLALLVKPSVEFVSLVFGLLKAGVVQVLIDPGMGRKNLIRCLAETKPDGFVAIPAVQVIRTVLRHKFPQARWNVTVGEKRWFWSGISLEQLRALGGEHAGAADTAVNQTKADEAAAIIFTTGSTGPPKGVLYRHSNFDKQVTEIRNRYGIQPGETNLACFPLFGLFNAAMGVTTVIPDMDASRPAAVDPQKIVTPILDWNVTQSFASPAVWNKVGAFCVERKITLPTLMNAYSAGAPVPPRVLETMLSRLPPGARMHTPYGATEALPVATIEAREVLDETRQAWAVGQGTCVGTRFPGIEWKVIRIHDGPICTFDRAQELPVGEIGELVVRGAVVTPRYVTRVEANATAKIHDADGYWHRMGDAGYLDDRGRFWFCGRTTHRVQTERETLFTDPVEGIFNQHPAVFRSALVGVGPAKKQRAIVCIELQPNSSVLAGAVLRELREIAVQHDVTRSIDTFLMHPAFPVDIRHNSKIFREQLAVWAEAELKKLTSNRKSQN